MLSSTSLAYLRQKGPADWDAFTALLNLAEASLGGTALPRAAESCSLGRSPFIGLSVLPSDHCWDSNSIVKFQFDLIICWFSIGDLLPLPLPGTFTAGLALAHFLEAAKPHKITASLRATGQAKVELARGAWGVKSAGP